MRYPDISVIVPVFNHWHLVSALLSRMDKQGLGKTAFEVLLVDNGSEAIPVDLSLPPWARLLICDTPGSYAARNEGIRSALGQLLAFTDADCLPTQQWLQNGLSTYQKILSDKRVLVAGGVSVEPRDWSNMTRSEAFDVIMGLPQERYVSRGYAVTANLFVPAAAFKDVGLFDEKRFSGGDAEFCRRATAKGWRLQYCGSAVVTHPARRDWFELKTKQQRVKGGQVASGSVKRRFMYGILSFLPPLRQCFHALISARLTLRHRVSACWVLIRLWGVGMAEVLKLLAGRSPERR